MAYFDKFLIKSLVFSLSLIMVVTMIPTNTFAVDSVSKSSIDIESDDSFDDDIVDIDTMRDMIDNGFEGYVDEDEDIYESDSNSNSCKKSNRIFFFLISNISSREFFKVFLMLYFFSIFLFFIYFFFFQ